MTKHSLCICTTLCLKDKTGGSDRVINLAKHVAKLNFNVYLIDISSQKSLKSFFRDKDKYYKIENDSLIEYSYPSFITLLIPGLTKLFQDTTNRIVSAVTLSSPSAVGIAYQIDPYLTIKLLYVGKKHNLTLLQNESTVTFLPAFIAKKLLNSPLVFDAHNIETDLTRSISNASDLYIAILKQIENLCFKCCDSAFVVSEFDKQIAMSWGIPPKKISVIPNSVNTTNVLQPTKDIKKLLNIAGKKIILFHGTLDYPPNKEAVELLVSKIMPKVMESEPNVILLIVGKNPPKIAQRGIITVGFVENLQDYIAAADICVVPLIKGGGTRIKIIEYMAYGKAIVSTFKGAEGLQVKNGLDIMMTKHPDQTFVNQILLLLSDGSLREKIGKSAKQTAKSLYDWDKTSSNAVEVYNNLLLGRATFKTMI